jgi:hypothetical protein
MITNPQWRHTRQLPLFVEEAEVPRWHDFNESIRKDAVRHLAQLLVQAQEASAAATALGHGGQDE